MSVSTSNSWCVQSFRTKPGMHQRVSCFTLLCMNYDDLSQDVFLKSIIYYPVGLFITSWDWQIIPEFLELHLQ